MKYLIKAKDRENHEYSTVIECDSSSKWAEAIYKEVHCHEDRKIIDIHEVE